MTILLIEQYVERVLELADEAVILRRARGMARHGTRRGDELLAEYLGGETASTL